MKEYLVPKFIERKPRIVGPLTFRQFIYIGIAGLISAILYFVLSLLPFILLVIFLFGIAVTLAFVRIGGQSLPVVLWNSITYLFSSKLYLWKKKKAGPKVIKKAKKEKKEEPVKGPSLKVVEKSRLKEMETKIKTSRR